MARASATPCRSPPESCPTIELGREHLRGETDLAHQPLGLGPLPRAIEKAQRMGQLATEEDVAHDRLLHAERAVLEHRLDAGVARARRVPARLALTAHQNFPAGRLDRAGEHLDQRRFAGAVIAEKAYDLAAIDVEIDAADREDPSVGLGDAFQFDQPFAHPRFSAERSGPARRGSARRSFGSLA